MKALHTHVSNKTPQPNQLFKPSTLTSSRNSNANSWLLLTANRMSPPLRNVSRYMHGSSSSNNTSTTQVELIRRKVLTSSKNSANSWMLLPTSVP